MTKNKYPWHLFFFLFSVAIYPINTILTPILIKFGLDSNGSRSIFIAYGLVFLFMMFILAVFPISLKRLGSLLVIYLIYVGAYFMTQPSLRSHFFQAEMILTYVLYLPYCVLIISEISDFSPLIKNPAYYGLYDAIIIGGFISNYFFDNPVGYMPFSYYLLPFWILYVFSMFEHFSYPRLIIGFIMILEGALFGARGPLLFLSLACLGAWLFSMRDSLSQGKWSSRRIWRFFGLIILILLMGWFLLQFIGMADVTDSYILSKIESGDLTGGAGRSNIARQAIDYIKTMGIRVNGPYYDRLILMEGLYSHNLILETMISFGWLIGSLILGCLSYVILSTWERATTTDRKMLLIFTCAFFLKYFISGSIYADWLIILYLSIVYSIRRKNTIQRNETR